MFSLLMRRRGSAIFLVEVEAVEVSLEKTSPLDPSLDAVEVS